MSRWDRSLGWIAGLGLWLPPALTVGIPWEAAVWAQGSRVIDDRVKGGADVGIF